jgi:hypothetical protein
MERVPGLVCGRPVVTHVPKALIGSVGDTIMGERNVSEKQDDLKKLIEKMRTNTDQLNRKTEAPPVRRSRRRFQKVRLEERRTAGQA